MDDSDVPLSPTASSDVRLPITSSCTANPFNADGSTCQGAAVGTPFFLFTSGTSARSLLAGAHQPGTPATGAATAISTSGATLNATVDPDGAPTQVSFQFGATTAYGQTTAGQLVGGQKALTPFNAALTGLTPGTTIHFRAVATSGFGTFLGADQALTTAATPVVKPPPPSPTGTVGRVSFSRPKVKGTKVAVQVSCVGTGGQSCTVTLRLTITVTHHLHKKYALAKRKMKVTHTIVLLGSATATVGAGQSKTITITLNRKAKPLLAAHPHLKVKLTGTQTLVNHTTRTCQRR